MRALRLFKQFFKSWISLFNVAAYRWLSTYRRKQNLLNVTICTNDQEWVRIFKRYRSTKISCNNILSCKTLLQSLKQFCLSEKVSFVIFFAFDSIIVSESCCALHLREALIVFNIIVLVNIMTSKYNRFIKRLEWRAKFANKIKLVSFFIELRFRHKVAKIYLDRG